MPWKYNTFTEKIDYYEVDSFKGVRASAPSDPSQGDQYFNFIDGTLYIYVSGTWYAMGSTTAPTQGSLSGQPIGMLAGITYP